MRPRTETDSTMKKYPKKSSSKKGYSLLELVLVIAIIAVLVGLLLPKGFDALRTARIQQVEKTVDTLKTAIVDYLALAGGNGSLPRTEGTGIPTSGAALTGATDIAKGNAARLDTAAPRHGSARAAVGSPHGHAVLHFQRHWQRAQLESVGAGLRDDSGRGAAAQLVPRHSGRSPYRQPGALPSAALGANFRLDGRCTSTRTASLPTS
jgi:prepilin-type N-terminal cleavage/methylation domain-containing protein